MWPGPYGNWGSRKYLLASLDQSLERLGLDYVDIFYSHRMDPATPLEETMLALGSAVRQGKALYVGLSNYDAATTRRAMAILKQLRTPCIASQPSYSMVNRWIERDGLLDMLAEEGLVRKAASSPSTPARPQAPGASPGTVLSPVSLTPARSSRSRNCSTGWS
jgi:L-glyceraldehyde 3-phosphate reductase